jgi:DNA-directed RNA polymerase subunit H (RpoH/RPB5)
MSPGFQWPTGEADIIPPPIIKRLVYSTDRTKMMAVILHFPNEMSSPITPYFAKEPHFLVGDRKAVEHFVTDLLSRSRIDSKIRTPILLVAPKPQNTANEAIRNLSSKNTSYEMFTLKEMSVDPIRHRLTPPHRVLTSEEVAEVKDKVKNLNYLPRIKQDDPVAKWLGCAPGQVIRFYRVPIMGIIPVPIDRLVENADEVEEGEEGEGEPMEGEMEEIEEEEGYDEDF